MNRPDKSPSRIRGSVRPWLLMLVCFFLGLTVAVILRGGRKAPAPPIIEEATLSASTLAVLKTLEAPVDIRFYFFLDPATTSPDLRAFAGRVDQMLGRFVQASEGKLKMTQFTKPADANAAAADGVKPFNSEKGQACFLGVTLANGNHKETLSPLAPEWEAALESDLTRAIIRLSAIQPAAAGVAPSSPPPDAVLIAEVRKAVPNLDAIPADEAKQKLRAASLEEIQAASTAIQQRVKELEQQAAIAQTNGTPNEYQATLQVLKQLQAEQADKLKQIAIRTQARIDAVDQIKRK